MRNTIKWKALIVFCDLWLTGCFLFMFREQWHDGGVLRVLYLIGLIWIICEAIEDITSFIRRITKVPS